MPNLTIPAGPEELTPNWLTDALRAGGVISEAKVTSFQKEILGEGAGFMGQLARVKLQYDIDAPDAPRSLIAKLPSNMPENRAVADAFRFYEREIRFYEQIAGEVELRTPHCYYSDMDVEAGRYILLLEDLAPAVVGDQLNGCIEQEAALAVTSLAKFHATWLESPRLSEIDWMPMVNDPLVVGSVHDSYAHVWPQFLERFGDKFSDETVRTGEKLGEAAGKIMDRMSEPPRTIIHGDYRLDNLFFGGHNGGDAFAVADWQIASRGRGVFDVAYFLSGGVPSDIRRNIEMKMLREYHQILTANNRVDYGFEQCLRDYRISVLFCLVYPVIGGGSVDLSNERGLALWRAITERNVTAIADLDAAELMPA